tara:strand:- start:555 stop:1193 length:639 start_codon:yes stop_codon:yes gene_type:complete
MKYKHIIWDWNGTLLDDRWLCVEGINKALDKRGLKTINEQTYKDIFSFPVKDYYQKLGFDFSVEPFEIAGDEFVLYYEKHFNRTKLHSQCRSIIKNIFAVGITQSILSAGKHEFLLEWVKAHNLQKYFIKILGIDNQYATGKTELGMSLIKNLSYNNNEVVLIGDTIHDSDVAESMNIDCLLMDQGHVNNDRLQKTGRKVFSNLTEVFQFII